jgi:hypothetical protein
MLVTGAILMGAGALLGLAGAAVGMSAVVSALRQYVAMSKMPPSELARQHWLRARSAARTGADAWLEFPKQTTQHHAEARLWTS